jgi:hypothetical protein
MISNCMGFFFFTTFAEWLCQVSCDTSSYPYKKVPSNFCRNWGWNEKYQDETSLCIGNKQGIKLVFSLLNLVFIVVSPQILDLPYLLLQLHCCSYSSIKLCGNKILQIIWTDNSQFHETVPNLAQFMTTLKLGLKQLNWW